jgi:hypothetical protein
MISEELIKLRSISNEQLDKFYYVSLSNFGMDLQGELSRGTADICKELNIELVWDNEYHVLRGKNEESGIKVCLTV